jgi:hypothetical protein
MHWLQVVTRSTSSATKATVAERVRRFALSIASSVFYQRRKAAIYNTFVYRSGHQAQPQPASAFTTSRSFEHA